MALITCTNCGKQISDKATACPHCGEPLTPVTNQLQSGVTHQTTQTPQTPRPTDNKNKILMGVCAGLAVLLALLVIPRLFSGSTTQGGYADSYVPAGNFCSNSGNAAGGQAETYYDVTLHVECKKNLMMNKYDVDILVDGQRVATLGHGLTDDYDLELSKGSHNVEFRVNGITAFGNDIYSASKKDTFQVKTISVSKNSTFSYRAKLVAGNGIEVDQLG